MNIKILFTTVFDISCCLSLPKIITFGQGVSKETSKNMHWPRFFGQPGWVFWKLKRSKVIFKYHLELTKMK